MLFCRNKVSKTPCPHCHKNLPYESIMYYFWNGAVNEINCPHCDSRIKPEKDVVPFWPAFGIGFFSVVLTGKLYIRFIDDNYVMSLIASAFIGILAMIIEFFYVIKKIKFIEV